MRDRWDEERRAKKEYTCAGKDPNALSPEIRKYFLEYHLSKNGWKNHKIEMAEIFDAYKQRLGKAGFLDMNL